MAKVTAKPQDSDFSDMLQSPVIDIKKQIAEIDKQIAETQSRSLKAGIATSTELLLQQKNDLQKLLKIKQAEEKALNEKIAKHRQDAEIKAAEEASNKREEFENAVTDKIIAYRQLGLLQSDKEASEFRKNLAEAEKQNELAKKAEVEKQLQLIRHNAQKSRLQAEIELLETVSAKSEKERQKELRLLDAKKNVLSAEQKLKAAKGSGDKKAISAAKKEKKEAKKELNKETGNTLGGGIKSGFAEAFKELREEIAEGNAVSKTAAENTKKVMQGVGKAITEGLNAINNSITAYAKHQTAINARLNGVNGYSGGGSIFQSAGFGQIAKNLNDIAFSPLLNAEELYNNVADIVGQGIAVNIEQRAMFATLKDGIAATFDVTSDSLKRIIRLQQNDSTAARLGLEAYLNEFLNVYVQNTEYLQSTFDTVASSLLEASALMKHNNSATGVQESLEFEFQVQKWLGTLTGYGFSDEASQTIANAIGQLATGDVDALTNSEINNLLLMAANKGGVSYSDMLSTGATAEDINNLMYGVVTYMQEIASYDNNIIKNQLAKTFGVGISDLIAATYIQNGILEDLHAESLTYDGMYAALEENFDALPGRLGISNILENAFANISYQTGANIAKNPALYALWKITDMIQSTTGGIAVPFISAMGNGFDLNTTVENLMKMVISGGALLGNIGSLIGGVATAGNGKSLLTKAKVSQSGATIQQIEGGLSKTNDSGKRESGDSSSSGAVAGNSDGDTYQDSAVNDANDDAQKKLDAAKEKEEDPTVKYLDEEVKFIDKLDAIVASMMQIEAGVLIASASNLRVAESIEASKYIISAIEQNSRTYFKKAVDPSTVISASTFVSAEQLAKEAGADFKGSNEAGSADSGVTINMSASSGLSKSDLQSELESVIAAVDGFKSEISELLTGKLDAEASKLSEIASTLTNIQTLNDEILKLIPGAAGSNTSNYMSSVNQDTNIQNDSDSYTFNMSSTVIETISNAVKISVLDALNDSSKSITEVVGDALNINNTDFIIPKGETSPLSSGDVSNNVVNEVTETILNSDHINKMSGYITSDMFATEFKSIVQNVARLAGERSTKEWTNPASSQATSSFNNNQTNYNADDSIDGLTQHSSGYNPLFI